MAGLATKAGTDNGKGSNGNERRAGRGGHAKTASLAHQKFSFGCPQRDAEGHVPQPQRSPGDNGCCHHHGNYFWNLLFRDRSGDWGRSSVGVTSHEVRTPEG